MKTIENDTVCTTAAMMSLTWLSAAMVATYKREHVVNIGKLTMNTYFMILEIWELEYMLRKMTDLQALYSENDFWTPDGDRTRNLLMTGETL